MWNPLRRSLAFGLICAMIGGIFGLLLYREGGDPYRFFFLASGTAGFLCGALLWRVLPERYPLRQPHWRMIWGGLAGGLTGITAHYLAWLLDLWAARLSFVLAGGGSTTLGRQPMTFLETFWGAARLTVYSLVLIGWLSLMLCSAAGGLWAAVSFRAGRGAGQTAAHP